MKFGQFLLTSFFFTVLAGCTGFVDELVGVITIDAPLTINTESKRLMIPSGVHNMSINFENGIMGVLEPKLVLKSGNKDFTIHIPRQAFNPKTNTIQANAAELKQPFSIDGIKEKVKLQEKVVEENVSCTFCGFCEQQLTSIDAKGDVASATQFATSCSCSGSRDALINKSTFEDRYKLTFLKRDNRPIAQFVGKGKIYVEKKVDSYLNECN